jgi:fatty-acid desaturase
MNTNAPPLIKRDGINRVSLTASGIFQLGAITALFFFSWPAFFTALALDWMTLSLGIGMGYHRLLTHRSYQPPK